MNKLNKDELIEYIKNNVDKLTIKEIAKKYKYDRRANFISNE